MANQAQLIAREEVLRRIGVDRIEPIQEVVEVDYDNAQQTPLAFRYRGTSHEVLELLGGYRKSPEDPSVDYLLRTNRGVYALYLDIIEPKVRSSLRRARWVLHFRVEDEGEHSEEGQGEGVLLLDIKLKLAADFHGHLCPDLVVGYRIARYAMEQLQPELVWAPTGFVVAENTTSALDAIQKLTGCTLGNGRLTVVDHGKHAYSFCSGDGLGVRLTLKAEGLPKDEQLASVEAKVLAGTASLLETARYRTMLDERIAHLLRVPDDAAIACRRVRMRRRDETGTTALAPCDKCGELVVESGLVVVGTTRLCRPCARLAQGA